MQNALFHERIEDAADEVCRAIGGRKKMAGELWPDKPQREAHNLIDACLNPDRRERFSPSQLLYIAKRDRLATVVEQSAKTLATALASLERLQRPA